MNAYRFSISWPRIQPGGSGEPLKAGMDFYSRLVDGLLKRNIQAFCDAESLGSAGGPSCSIKIGAGLHRDTAYRFAEHAYQIDRLAWGSCATSIATHNEPWVTATLGHEIGIFAPGIKDRAIATQVSHNLLLSHGPGLCKPCAAFSQTGSRRRHRAESIAGVCRQSDAAHDQAQSLPRARTGLLVCAKGTWMPLFKGAYLPAMCSISWAPMRQR